MTTLNDASRILGVARQTLAYYYQKGLLTGVPAGGVTLVDPEVTRVELEKLGHFKRRDVRREKKQLREKAVARGR